MGKVLVFAFFQATTDQEIRNGHRSVLLSCVYYIKKLSRVLNSVNCLNYFGEKQHKVSKYKKWKSHKTIFYYIQQLYFGKHSSDLCKYSKSLYTDLNVCKC